MGLFASATHAFFGPTGSDDDDEDISGRSDPTVNASTCLVHGLGTGTDLDHGHCQIQDERLQFWQVCALAGGCITRDGCRVQDPRYVSISVTQHGNATTNALHPRKSAPYIIV